MCRHVFTTTENNFSQEGIKMSSALEIHETLRAKKWEGQDWAAAQIKLDGYRVTAYLDTHRKIQMYGKDHRPHLEFLSRFPRLKKTWFYRRLLVMPPYSSVDAEIIVPGGTSSDVATALRDENIPIDLITFAIPMYKGKMQVDKDLGWANTVASAHGLIFAKWFSCAALRRELGFEPDDYETVRDMLVDKAVGMGYEGFVLKQTQYKGWYKVKQSQMVDCIIVGVVAGEGKYTDQIGALVVAVLENKNQVIIANVSGMIDAERLALTHLWKKNKLFGKVVEVKYQEVGSKGRLRHPRFSRMRPDKPAKDCTINQLIDNC